MNEYMSVTQTANKWGLGRRRTLTLLTQGRVSDAIMVGGRWIIPANAKKPADARIKSGKYIKQKESAGQ